jgi:flavin-dependent dehydrogenase
VGALVLQPCAVFSPLIDDGRVAGLHTSLGPITARCVVDAGGGNHWLGRHLGVRLRRYSPQLFVRYGYFSGANADAREAPSFRALPDGWQWTATVRPGRSHWARLSWSGSAPERCEAPVIPGQPRVQEPVRTADVSWRILERVAGPGFFVAGDAAAVLDPASSHGVLRAVMSGMMAARCAAQLPRNPATAVATERAYDQWLQRWFLFDVHRLQALYCAHPAPPPWLITVRGSEHVSEAHSGESAAQ